METINPQNLNNQLAAVLKRADVFDEEEDNVICKAPIMRVQVSNDENNQGRIWYLELENGFVISFRETYPQESSAIEEGVNLHSEEPAIQT